MTKINDMLSHIGPGAPTTTNASGGRQSATVARLDLVPSLAWLGVGKVLKAGAEKYGVDNWRKIDWRSHLNHALNHAAALLAGDTSDDHIGHFACRAMMAHEMFLVGEEDQTDIGWIDTFSGGRMSLLDPEPASILADDIAHALSQLCRYTGHTSRFLSVAEHCLIVSDICGARGGSHLALLGLLHDATEAYINDIARPLKVLLPKYKEIERRLAAAIYEAFLVIQPDAEETKAIKLADNIALKAEAQQLLTGHGHGWSFLDDIPDIGIIVECLDPPLAEARYSAELARLLAIEHTLLIGE